MTDATFAEILALLTRAYGVTFDPETKRVWRLLLDPLADESVRAAAVTLCRSSPYPPKPADLFRLVRGSPDDAERRLDEEAELAVVHLERHVCDHRLVDLGPLLNAVVRAMGGLDAVVSRMIEDGWKYERGRAKTLYRAFSRRGVTGDEGAVLMPAAMAESLARVPLSVYQERGLPLPLVRVLFEGGGAPALPAGPAMAAAFPRMPA